MRTRIEAEISWYVAQFKQTLYSFHSRRLQRQIIEQPTFATKPLDNQEETPEDSIISNNDIADVPTFIIDQRIMHKYLINVNSTNRNLRR